MPNKPSINDIPNRISANFFALIGFANFVLIFGFTNDYSSITFKEFLIMLGLIYFIFGAITIVCSVILLPLFFLLRTSNKKTSIIALLLNIILYIFIIYRLYVFFIIEFNVLELFNIYNYTYPIWSYLFLLLISHFIDKKAKITVKNTYLLNNKYYRKFITIFYYYFWILYIPFFLVYSILIFASL
mgnify:FL=1